MIDNERNLKSFRFAWFTIACIIVLILLVELPIWLKIHRHGFHNFDLGIYSQALQLIEWGNFNPFLTVRNVNVFNDHFDPILLLAVPFARFWEPAFVGATVEFLMVMTSGIYAAVSLRRSGTNIVMAGAVMAFLLFNRGTISALMYPFHPTTWAILPMTMLVIAMLKDRKVEIFLSLTLLFLCKEEFPFVGVMLAIGCFFKRQHRFGGLVLLWSSAWILFDYGIRPGLLGEGTDHARRVLGPLMEDPIGRLVFLLGEIEVQRLIAIAIPLVPLLLVTRREGVKIRYDILLLLVPLVGIRFLGGTWRHHYLAVLVPVLLGTLGSALEPSPTSNPSRMNNGFLWCLILLAITNADPIKKNARTLAGTFGIGRDAVQPERLVMIEQGMNWLRAHDGRALVQGNLLPRLVDKHEIYQVRGARPPGVTSFDFVFVEKPPHGDPWPVEHQDYARLIERWRRVAFEIVIDDEHVFLARGLFGDRN